MSALTLRTGLPAARSFVGTLPNIVTATFGVLGSLVVVAALGLYLAADPATYRNGFARLFTPRYRDYVLATLDEAGGALQRWLYGQFVSMIVVGVFAYVSPRLLGVPLALALAIPTALLDFVPYIGAIAAAVPVTLVAFGEDPRLALYALGVYTAIQVGEGNLFVPLIHKRAISVAPGIIIASQVLLGVLFGLIGSRLSTSGQCVAGNPSSSCVGARHSSIAAHVLHDLCRTFCRRSKPLDRDPVSSGASHMVPSGAAMYSQLGGGHQAETQSPALVFGRRKRRV